MKSKIMRKLLVLIEAVVVFGGAFLLNVHILGKQNALPGGHQPEPTRSEHPMVVASTSEESGALAERTTGGLVSLPAPFTAEEIDRLARELFAERDRLRAESDALARDRRELERITKDLRSRRDAFRERIRAAPALPTGPTKEAAPAANPRVMAQIFDKMRAEAAATRLAEMEPSLAAAVLGRMSSKQAAKALGAMDAKVAAVLATKIPTRKKTPKKGS